ncbi:MAG: hypothetical protein NVSMB55_18590 [Mycobacteriales bacterium]
MVLLPIVHDQLAAPLLSAAVCPRPADWDWLPLGSVTDSVQVLLGVAPVTVAVAVLPRGAGSLMLVMHGCDVPHELMGLGDGAGLIDDGLGPAVVPGLTVGFGVAVSIGDGEDVAALVGPGEGLGVELLGDATGAGAVAGNPRPRTGCNSTPFGATPD